MCEWAAPGFISSAVSTSFISRIDGMKASVCSLRFDLLLVKMKCLNHLRQLEPDDCSAVFIIKI